MMNVGCSIGDACFKTFEQRVSMAKADKHATGHRVRCVFLARDLPREQEEDS